MAELDLVGLAPLRVSGGAIVASIRRALEHAVDDADSVTGLEFLDPEHCEDLGLIVGDVVTDREVDGRVNPNARSIWRTGNLDVAIPEPHLDALNIDHGAIEAGTADVQLALYAGSAIVAFGHPGSIEVDFLEFAIEHELHRREDTDAE